MKRIPQKLQGLYGENFIILSSTVQPPSKRCPVASDGRTDGW